MSTTAYHIPTHVGPLPVRNLVHALLALGIALVGPRIEPMWFYTGMVLLTAVFAWGRQYHFLAPPHDRTHVSFGEFFFIAGVLISYYFFSGNTHAWHAALFTLAFADPLAAMVGNRYGKISYSIAGERRTVEGTLTCIVLTSLILAGVGVSPMWALAGGSIVGTIENLSLRGLDNLTVPVVAGLIGLLALY